MHNGTLRSLGGIAAVLGRFDSELSDDTEVTGGEVGLASVIPGPRRRDLLRWEMGVGESDHLVKVLLINLSEDSVDGEGLCRKPDIIDHTTEAWRVVRRQRVLHQRVRALEAETVFRSF